MSITVSKRWRHRLTTGGVCLLFLLPLLGIHVKTYLTLTIAGLAMGMLLFLISSGVSIIFGLMDVLNFAHGALFALGNLGAPADRWQVLLCIALDGGRVYRQRH